MSRAVGAKCRLCRRAKERLYLKGDKCASSKCPVAKRPFPPGQHGKLPLRSSEYSLRLREKQKAKQIYGLTERQFKKYFEEASRRTGATGGNLLMLLEERLDNVIYRLGFMPSRAASRQLVLHGHITINGKKVNIPSYLVRAGDVISVKEKSAEKIKKDLEAETGKSVPSWLSLAAGKAEGSVLRGPKREDIDTLIEEHLIVEFYSR